MDPETRRALDALNRRFYREHGAEFAETRDHPWPGWRRALAVPGGTRPRTVLDVGCGNARLARFLADAGPAPDLYVGLDRSATLLAAARRRLSSLRWVALVRADFAGCPEAAMPVAGFDRVALFGVLHHVPGFSARRSLVRAALSRTAPGGRLAVSLWRFAEDPRTARRILDWARAPAPIDPARLEPGDHLLRWGAESDPPCARYCHAMDDAEWTRLAAGLPAREVDRFESDGRSGDGNRYVVLEPTGG